jgi:hypothetical protein
VWVFFVMVFYFFSVVIYFKVGVFFSVVIFSSVALLFSGSIFNGGLKHSQRSHPVSGHSLKLHLYV